MGAIIGGASENKLNIMHVFVVKFGLAFQIKDDILDFTSTTEIMGKTVGKDENSNKSTYVTIFGLDNACKKLTNAIEECYDILNSNGLKSDILQNIIKSLEN